MSASEKFRCSAHLAVEQAGRDSVVIKHVSSGHRMRLGRPLYRLLRTFEKPKPLCNVVARSEDQRQAASEFLLRMVHVGFLVQADAREAPWPEPLIHPTPLRLFGAAPFDRTSPSEFTILGVPYDGGSTAGGGARNAPDSIRAAFQDPPYTLDFQTCQPCGWFDENRDEWILRGTTLSDQGNLVVRPGEDPSRIFERTTAAVKEVLDLGSVPVVLGGDHSITFPVLRAFSGRPLVVVHFDAHTDCSPYDANQEHHHGNVFSRVLTLAGITDLVQLGVRGYLARDAATIGDVRRTGLTPRVMRRLGPLAILERIPDTHDLYVSVDIDVLDPAVAPGTRTPRTDGLAFAELRDLLHLIGSRRRVAGLDMVEVNPERDLNGITSLVAADLLLGFLGAVSVGFEGSTAARGRTP